MRLGANPNPPRPAWSGRTVWYWDPVNGNDTNDGSILGPLKTWAQLERCIGDTRITFHLFVFALSAIPANDPIHIRFNMGKGGEVHLIGTETAVAGTAQPIVAVTAINRATNTHQRIAVNAAFNWSLYLKKLIRITASAVPGNVGATAVVESDIGAGVAQVSPFQKTVIGTSATISWSTMTLVTPLAGDTIEVVDLLDCAETPYANAGSGGSAYAGRFTFEDFAFAAPSTIVGTTPLGGALRFLRCTLTGANVAGVAYGIFNACYLNGGTADDSAILEIRGGLLSGTLTAATSSAVRLNSDAMISAGRIIVSSFRPCVLGSVGVTSTSGPLCTVTALGAVSLSLGTALYGATGNRVGFDLSAGARLVVPTGTTPTLDTGAAANIALHNAVTKTWADCAATYTNPANGAQILAEVA